MTAKRYKAYLMQFEPKWPPLTHSFIDVVMKEADFCMDAPRGLRVGHTFRAAHVIAEGPNGRSPAIGVMVRVVGLSHHGKLATLEELAED